MLRRAARLLPLLLPLGTSLLLLGRLLFVWSRRLPYAFDLEWMEGGMLAHAWRLAHGRPLYVEPGPEFIPFVYPPGYAAVVAAFGAVFGLHPTLGRGIALAGFLLAAGAVGFVVKRHGGSSLVAFCAAMAFLGTYPHSGAFYDLVRPDGLFVGALAWSIALALDGRRGTAVAAGLLLAVAFLAKHNAGAFGIPLVLGLLVRDGVRGAVPFALASAVPAGALTALLQWRSDGRFLTYLLGVPGSHPSFFFRVWPETFREVGTPLPFVLAVPTVWILWKAVDGQRSIPKPLAAFLPVAIGVLAGCIGTYVPPPPDSGMYNAPASIAFFAAGAVPVALGVWLVGRALDGVRPIVSWRWVAGLATIATTFGVGAAMRAHNGGFLNVHVPLFLVASMTYGLVLCRIAPTPRGKALLAAILVGQALWARALVDPWRLTPTAADREMGERFVEAARTAEGPVLSPWASWIPVYAGQEPSLHYEAVWDLEYPETPFPEALPRIAEAVRERRWAMVLAGNREFKYGVADRYEVRDTFIEDRDKTRVLMPKTGWRARPQKVLVPR